LGHFPAELQRGLVKGHPDAGAGNLQERTVTRRVTTKIYLLRGRVRYLSSDSEKSLTHAIAVPTLIMHGDDDQIVPISASAMLSSKIVKNAQLKVYKGAPHGMLRR
jgi:pimeloyl-ACP methyl ester carboxylesterase